MRARTMSWIMGCSRALVEISWQSALAQVEQVSPPE